jgi:hypothetical protein
VRWLVGHRGAGRHRPGHRRAGRRRQRRAGAERGAAALTRLFPIGVYVQAPDNFGLWKSRGVNTMVVVPDGNSETAWNKAAIRDGLYEIRAPASNPASDVGDKNLLAWALPMSLTT